ncbi:translocation/assembly module TamB domain-containing protein [Desulfurispira natronophila]|uniref:Translocation and assembly module TamB n=1 Tax=Desulfurispira natronophila TaxID=682562 RepID=A0A7W7Y566_9BACT|nr:translocation/assembly module TamB domain-containing protein [Desulfurispira natronophila]MBB5022300.1 translocation and assembly module TamB [Desulfurispira natronophila]
MKKILLITGLLVLILAAGILWISQKVEGVVDYLQQEHGLEISYRTLSANLTGIFFSDLTISYASHHASFEEVRATVFWQFPLSLPGVGVVFSNGQVELASLDDLPVVASDAKAQKKEEASGMSIEETIGRYSALFRGIQMDNLDVQWPGGKVEGVQLGIDDNFQFRLRTELIEVSGEELRAFNAHGRLRPDRLQLDLTRASLGWQDYTLRAYGTLDRAGMEVVLFSQLPLDIPHLSSRVDLEVRVHGPWDEIGYEGEVHTLSATVLGYEDFPDLEVYFQGDFSGLTASVEPRQGDDLHLLLAADFASGDVELKATLHELDLQRYLMPRLPFIAFEDISGVVTGRWIMQQQAFAGSAELDFCYDSFWEPLEATVNTDVVISSRGVRFLGGQVRSPAFEAQGGGKLSYDFEDFFSLWFNGTAHDLAPILRAFNVDFIEGTSRFHVDLHGPLRSPLLEVAVDAPYLEIFDGELQDASGQMWLDGRSLQFQSVRARSGDGEALVPRGSLTIHAVDEIKLDLDFYGSDIALGDALAFGNIGDLPLLPTIQRAEGRVWGEVRDLQVQARGELSPHELGGMIIPALRVEGGLAHRRVSAKVQDEQEQHFLEGWVDFDGDMALQAQGQQLDMQEIWSEMPSDWSVAASSYAVDVEGTVQNPVGRADIHGVQVSHKSQDLLVQSHLQLDYRDQVLTAEAVTLDVLSPLIASGHGSTFSHRVAGEGRGEQELFSTLSTELGTLEVRASLEALHLVSVAVEGEVDLRMVPLFVDDQLQASGAARIVLEGDDVIVGQIRMLSGSELYHDEHPQLRVRQLSSRVYFDRTAMQGGLENISLRIGRDGTGTGQVRFEFPESGAIIYDVQYQVRNLFYQERDNIFLLDSQGEIHGDSRDEPVGVAQVDVRRGQINIRTANGDGTPAAPAPVIPGDWTVHVRGGSPVRVSLDQGNLMLLPDVEGRLYAGTLNLEGRIEVLSGALVLNRDHYVLQRGFLEFDGGMEPRLDITATTSKQGHQVFVHVTGTSDNPQLRFRSIPALPQEQIVSLLVLGSYDDDISPTAAASHVLANQVAETLNTMTGPVLRGEAAFRVAPSGLMGESPDIALTTELSERMEIRITRELSAEGAQQFQVIYKLFDFLHVRGREEFGGSYGVDLEYRIGR